MGQGAKYLAVYDVSEDGERNRVAKVLEGYGVRVQKSAFECQLTRGSLATLQTKLKALDVKEGFVFVYRLQANGKRLAFGTVPPNPLDDANYAFVI